MTPFEFAKPQFIKIVSMIGALGACLAGCVPDRTNQCSQSRDNTEAYFVFDQHYARQSCPSVPPGEHVSSVGPEKYERDAFVNRISVAGIVETPINIKCITNKYSKQELMNYAKQNDPIAKLALLYLKLSSQKNICDDVAKNISEFKSITLSNKYSDYIGPSIFDAKIQFISRAPEGLAVANELAVRCANERPIDLQPTAAEFGYYRPHHVRE